MYYFDCACEHDRFQEFKDKESAVKVFNETKCKNQILYRDGAGDHEPLFVTIMER